MAVKSDCAGKEDVLLMRRTYTTHAKHGQNTPAFLRKHDAVRPRQEMGVAPDNERVEEIGMNGAPDGPWFSILKALSYVALAAMTGAILYAAAMALRYWPGIAV
jgi:hypothetical protein